MIGCANISNCGVSATVYYRMRLKYMVYVFFVLNSTMEMSLMSYTDTFIPIRRGDPRLVAMHSPG